VFCCHSLLALSAVHDEEADGYDSDQSPNDDGNNDKTCISIDSVCVVVECSTKLLLVFVTLVVMVMVVIVSLMIVMIVTLMFAMIVTLMIVVGSKVIDGIWLSCIGWVSLSDSTGLRYISHGCRCSRTDGAISCPFDIHWLR